MSKHETSTVTKQTTGAVSKHETGNVAKQTTGARGGLRCYERFKPVVHVGTLKFEKNKVCNRT